VLPGEAKEIEPRDIGDAPAVAQAPLLVEDRQHDPRIVGPIAGRPDHGVDLDFGAVSEANRMTFRVDRARLQVDPVAPLEFTWTRANQCVPGAQLAAKT
jgi:hypothetical protein